MATLCEDPASADPDRGSAAVEFVLVSFVLVFLLFGVLQVAGYFYVRSIAAAAAADGARYGADAGVDAGLGGSRASLLIGQGLGTAMAARLPCVGAESVDATSGLATARVECRGRIVSIFLPAAALVTIDVHGQSLREQG